MGDFVSLLTSTIIVRDVPEFRRKQTDPSGHYLILQHKSFSGTER